MFLVTYKYIFYIYITYIIYAHFVGEEGEVLVKRIMAREFFGDKINYLSKRFNMTHMYKTHAFVEGIFICLLILIKILN